MSPTAGPTIEAGPEQGLTFSLSNIHTKAAELHLRKKKDLSPSLKQHVRLDKLPSCITK